MTIDTIIEILKAVLSGRTGPFEAVHANPLLILIPFIIALLGYSARFLSMPGEARVGSAAVSFLMAAVLAILLVTRPNVPHAPLPSQTGKAAGGTASNSAPATFDVRADQTLMTRMTKAPFAVNGKDECERHCASEPECKAYSYDNETKSCGLRFQVGDPIPFKGSIIGIKIGNAPFCSDGTCTAVQVFYGTDRVRTALPERVDFGRDRANRMYVGNAIVTVPRKAKRRIGEITRPTLAERWLQRVPTAGSPEKHFMLPPGSVSVYESEEAFLDAVRVRISEAGTFKDHAILFVHGYATTFEYALYRTAQLTHDLGSEGEPFGTAFLYSWPSGGALSDYKHDFDSARLAVDHLAAFLRLVLEKTDAKHVHLIAHSMGSWPMLEALKRLPQGEAGRAKLGELVLAAPDIDATEFLRMADQIKQTIKGITLYASASDTAMHASRTVHGRLPRAGDIVDGSPVLLRGVDTIDITPLGASALSWGHSDFAERRELLNDIALIFRKGERPPPSRTPILQTIHERDHVFWRFPN